MDVKTETLRLTIEKIIHLQVISNELLQDSNFSFEVLSRILFDQDETMIRGVYRLATHEELLATYPADWWEAFKARWFPAWLLKRYPVKYTEIYARHKFPEYGLGKEFVDILIRKPEYY